MWVLCTLALIGGTVVAIVLTGLFIEGRRAFRQGRRLAYVYARANGKRRPPLKWILKLAVHDFFSSYDTTTISVWKLPHNPSKPIRRAFYWYR
jgi:hypothetical protein